jgi:prenyl protein peptidase
MLYSPLVFGVAHVHHYFEVRIARPDIPMYFALLNSFIQLCFTSLFGTYATFIFLRTGSLLAVIVIHAFCNSIGLPRFWGRVRPYWCDDSSSQRKPDMRGNNYYCGATACTILYYILLPLGAYHWWQGLYSMSLSNQALVSYDLQ